MKRKLTPKPKKQRVVHPDKVASRAEEIARKKVLIIAKIASGLSVTTAAVAVGATRAEVFSWRRKDVEFSQQYMEAMQEQATANDDPEMLEREAYALAKAGNVSMIQFMLKAHFPTLYCDKARTLAFIDDQARAAAKAVASGGVSDSAAIILAHLNKLASEKAGLATGG
jgi:hypothetical protein